MKIPLTAIHNFKQLRLMPSILDTGHECVAEDCCTKSLAEWNFEIELNVKMESQHKVVTIIVAEQAGTVEISCGRKAVLSAMATMLNSFPVDVIV